MPVKVKSGTWGSSSFVEAIPKKTRQGTGKHTKYSATSRNGAKKKYRGQGRRIYFTVSQQRVSI